MAKSSFTKVLKQIRKGGRIMGTNKFTTKLAKHLTKVAIREIYGDYGPFTYRKGGRIQKGGHR